MNKLVYLIITLLIISSVLGFQMYSNSKEISSLSNELSSAKNKVSDLNNIVNDKIKEINTYKFCYSTGIRGNSPYFY